MKKIILKFLGVKFDFSLGGFKRWRRICFDWQKILFLKLGFIRNDFILNLNNGLKLNILYEGKDDSTSMLKDIYMNKPYPLEETKNCEVIVDIGANQGFVTTLIAKRNKNAKIFAYEPIKKTYDFLIRNILLNGFENQIIAFNQAVSNKKGKIKIFLDKQGNAGNSIIQSHIGNNKFVNVDSITLKDVFEINEINKIDFLKMVCEGAEYEIFFNTKKKYLSKIHKLAMEIHPIKEYKMEDLKKFLIKNGFEFQENGNNIYEIYAINKKFKKS
jgi:FkbM family methyltransferase